MPDYSTYTLAELKEAYSSVNKEQYPDNYRTIKEEILLRKKECDELFTKALAVREEGKNEEALELLTTIARKYPGTEYGKKAEGYLKGIKVEVGETAKPAKQRPALELRFSGSVREYFRLWIVNLCLSLLSLGIYSAWAKVRKKRYIYANLTLDSTPFQYLGMPVPILKGRIIAAIAFLLYFSSNNLFPPMLPYVLTAGVILAPWVFVQSIAFNARYTAFRNMTFRFDGTPAKSLLVLSAWGLIPAFVVGMWCNWWGNYWLAAVFSIPGAFLFPVWLKEIKKLIVTKTCYGGVYGQFEATGLEFFGVYFVGGLILFLFGMIVAAVSFGFISSIGMQNFTYFAYASTAITYLGYLLAFAYIQANITNKVWNKLQLGPLSFSCSLKGRELAKIYVTNVLGIICSFGLLIPWAVIRTFHYRIDHTRVFCDGDLATFQAQREQGVQAVGAELTEFFDMDLSL